MSTVQKVALAIVGVGAITAMSLPGRQFASGVNAIGSSLLTNPLRVAVKG